MLLLSPPTVSSSYTPSLEMGSDKAGHLIVILSLFQHPPKAAEASNKRRRSPGNAL